MTKPAWNKGKSIGQKKPFTALQIQFLQDHLAVQENHRELALFSFQIDSMLRSSDILKLKVEDVVDWKGEVKREINIKQKKTGKPHVIELSEKTAQIVADLIKKDKKVEADWLFSCYGNRNKKGRLSYCSHWMMMKKWAAFLGVDPRDFGTHTGRRTRAVMVFRETKSIPLVQNS